MSGPARSSCPDGPSSADAACGTRSPAASSPTSASTSASTTRRAGSTSASSGPTSASRATRSLAVRAIERLYRRAHDGEHVETACKAGKGRTGTVVACLAILDGLTPSHAVSWTREHYHYRAVQTPWQRRWVLRFAEMSRRRA